MALNFLVRGDEVHRIELPDGGWIEIQKHVTTGQRDRWAKSATKQKTRFTYKKQGKKTQREGESLVDFDNEGFTIAMLVDIVKAWSDELPVNAENIRRMPESIATLVIEEFERLNPQPAGEDDEEDEVLGESDAGSKATSDPAGEDFQTNWPS